ncbi:hypothetical protein SUGI_0691060 [Cryptomeria japonica]|uniref:uncharacterized protein LOC131038023 n=1 Tax=Cryptomeria japonica TaxID=3369 RepID=UPI002414729F|nr:uncharacterized protein LOC131038023 [Cryptomeria japonica]GLJ34369.1 hypothetical protein SUGI_0691060 [Cryptomeria japonica]
MLNLASSPMKIIEETAHAMKEKRSLPEEAEAFPTLASANTSSLHANALVQPLSPNLFRVMRIVSDQEDHSVVEKIQLPQDEVLSLCNKLVPSSASAFFGEPPRVHINFNSLNQLCLPAVGFYGDKNMIIAAFRKESLVDYSVLAVMEGGLFEAGLYVSLPDKVSCVVVFYWHEGEQLKQASRKDVSCNFIRYLVELCDSVYVCAEGSYPFEALAASAGTASSIAKPSRRIQESSVKNSENDVELLPGYNVRIDGGNSKKSSLESSDNVEIVNTHNGTVVFCEGYHHCCFLTTEKKASKISKKTEEVCVKPSGFDDMFQSWSSASNIDYSRLSNEQFINLLKNCQPQEFENYSKFKEPLMRSESGINIADFDEFERCILNVAPEFCRHVLLLVGGETELVNACKPNSFSNMDIDADGFDQLHGELSAILAGKDNVCRGDQRLLLLGSDIEFVSSDGEHVITVESMGQEKQTPPFISYGQEVDAKCSSQCACSTKINGKAKFVQPSSSIKDFPLSGEIVTIVFFPVTNKSGFEKEIEGEVHLVNKIASCIAIRSWVENMVPIELRSLERNIAFAAFLLAFDKSLGLTFIEEHLTTRNTQILPPEIQVHFEKFCSVHPAQLTVDLDALSHHDILKTVCCQVYKGHEDKFRENIKELWSRLFRKGQCFGNTRLRKMEDEFIRELKKKMSAFENDNLVTRFIEEVTVGRQARSFWPGRIACSEQVELKVKVSIEEKHALQIVYKVCDLTPVRKDLSEVNNNCKRPIVPTCGDPLQLAVINPQHERLFKVVVLKSGELMVFIHSFRDSSLYLYRGPKTGFYINNMGYPIHAFRRGFDLVAVDETIRSMALYEKEKCRILIYKFDESFMKADSTGVEVNLESFGGSKIIIWMHFIPGKMELLLVDDTNSAWVVEIHKEPMIKDKHISLPLQQQPLRACISVEGYFFLVFRQLQRQGEDIDDTATRYTRSENILDIYVLGDIMSYLKSIPLNAIECSISDLEQLTAKVTSFGSQIHLFLCSPVDAPGVIYSNVLKISLAKEIEHLQQASQIKAHEDETEETEIVGSCPYLGYIYRIFDKFAIEPKLFPSTKKCITFKVILDSGRSDRSNTEASIKYLTALIRQLMVRKGEDFSSTKIQVQVDNIENYPISAATEQQKHMKMGMWIRKLLCLVPIKIARVENNAMIALTDGLPISTDVSYVGSLSVAVSIRFGFYDAVLSSWKGKIKVISSIGNRSSGKSYLLNHLSGSLLDVGGGRCTDGVWMTVATGEDEEGSGESGFLYVLLDFEGLGSLERSEQEDSLLCVLNAAVSNITIFNKLGFHFDKVTESSFSQLQSEINLLKHDKKLFKGLFYIAIKDVDTSDVEDLIQEFHEKISQICSKSEENLILDMYDRKTEIVAMVPYNRSEYYTESLSNLVDTVAERNDFCYGNGFAFLRDLKLIIEQISKKNWTSVGSKRVAVTLDILRRNLISAINMGCLSVRNANEELRVLDNFHTQEEVPDPAVVFWDYSWNIRDSGLFLSPCTESATPVTMREVFSQLRSKLEIVIPRDGSNAEEWHSLFDKSLEALVERRHHRVQQWISSNTTEFHDNAEVQQLQLEADVALGKIKEGLSVCGCKCSACFWRCLMEKGHNDHHSCMWSHSCTECCSFCARQVDIFCCCYCVPKTGRKRGILSLCRDLAGHGGFHDCRRKKHTCGERCYLYGVSSYCNELCSLRSRHQGQHKCNSPRHMCSTKCSLPTCCNSCALPIESNHIRHECPERYCQSKCTIDGCSRTCGVEDHFHDLNLNAEHFCGKEHVCTHECEKRGICEIFTELVKQTQIFQGQRGSFEYEIVSEQNGLRKGCCIPIPPFKRDHEGPHVHTQKKDSVHFCETRCPSCGGYCHLPIDHLGLHDTVHGSMRNVRFISEGENIDIENRKYKWGETGEAEMCNIYCKKQGRGHIHLVPCPGSGKCTGNLYDGSRHETVKYGPDVDVPKDEMTHKTFWQYVGFVDLCTEEEREGFDCCNHYCISAEHQTESGTFDKSYCTAKLWHPAIKSTGEDLSSVGYITDDGHHFGCYHSKKLPHHVIFIIDRSGSMNDSDISPTLPKFNDHRHRLGCVYEAILRFIQGRLRTVSNDSVSVVLFDDNANVVLEMEDLNEGIVDRLLKYGPGGGTTYTAGLSAAETILMKGVQHHNVDVKKPLIFFLSDGENWDGEAPVQIVDRMKKADPRMILHTIMFGTNTTTNILIEMAKKGGGTFEQTLDANQLAHSFENLHKSLKPQVAALMRAPDAFQDRACLRS